MDLKRFFSENIDYERGTAVLTGEEFHHAVKVTRHKVGYKLIICGDGLYDYYCTVKDIDDGALYAQINRREINDCETNIPVSLFVGANKDLDSVVQKAVELGVSYIVPFFSSHCNVDKINIDRLKKIVLESSKQCGRAKLADVSDLVTLQGALEMTKNSDIMFFYEFEREKKVSDCSIPKNSLSVFIGCEGGFSKEENELISSYGANRLTLGKRILRVSTAVVSALTLIMEAIGEM